MKSRLIHLIYTHPLDAAHQGVHQRRERGVAVGSAGAESRRDFLRNRRTVALVIAAKMAATAANGRAASGRAALNFDVTQQREEVGERGRGTCTQQPAEVRGCFAGRRVQEPFHLQGHNETGLEITIAKKPPPLPLPLPQT